MGVRSGPACAPGLPLLSPPGRAPVAARAVTRLTNKLRRTQACSTFHFVSMTRPECLGVTSARLIEEVRGVFGTRAEFVLGSPKRGRPTSCWNTYLL